MLSAGDVLLAPLHSFQARRNLKEAERLMLDAESMMLHLEPRLPPGWREKFNHVYRMFVA
jgi:hypothetical protein